jgi:DNA polymerase I-like protein with 3'-5' exonuclease and polymerase domains
VNRHYTLVNTPKKLHWLFQKLRSAKRLAFDIETDHTTGKSHRAKDAAREFSVLDIEVIGCSFSWAYGEAAYLPLYKGNSGRKKHWPDAIWPAVIAGLKEILESSTPKIMHNGKFDVQWIFRNFDIEIAAFVFDTMLAHYLLDEKRAESNHGLKDLTAAEWPESAGYENDLHKALEYHDPVMQRYSSVPLDILYEYACGDVDYTLRLADIFAARLTAEGLDVQMDEITMPLQWVCVMAERIGIPVDIPKTNQLIEQYTADIATLTEQSRELAGVDREFNFGSPDQLAELLYVTFGLPEQRDPKTGEVTVDGEALEALAKLDPHPCLPVIAKLRKKTYALGLFHMTLKGVDKKTGRIYPNFKLHQTSTGRIACENPNTQNWPRPPNGIDVKDQFCAPDGMVIVMADQSQIELRVAATLSKEPVWLSAFLEDQDLHSKTAKAIFNLDCLVEMVKELYDDKRTAAKCFHPDTEVLTRSGWKRILDLSDGEQIAQAVASDGYKVDLSWVTPIQVYSMPNEHDHLIHLKNEGIDIRVTPDHGMLAFGVSGKPKRVMPHEMAKQRTWANAGILADTGGEWAPDEALLRIAVAVQADGSIKGQDGDVRLGFSKQRKIDRCRELLTRAGVKFTEHTRDEKPKQVTVFRIPRTEAEPILALLDEKKFDHRWLTLTAALREVVLDEVNHWDSHVRPSWKMVRYSSMEKQNIDILQGLASLSGRKTRIGLNDPHGCYHLSIKDHHLTRGENLDTWKLAYTGEVACLAVPSSTILVRDGGVPVILKNSINFGILYGQTEYGLSNALKITREEAAALIEKYFENLGILKEYLDTVVTFARNHGYVVNEFGRRRRVPQLLAYIPEKPRKPASAPTCWGRVKESANLLWTKELKDIDLPRQLPMLEDTRGLQDLAGPIKERCGKCHQISGCTLEILRRSREQENSKLEREVQNFMIQSTATADLTAIAWAQILKLCVEVGIPLLKHHTDRDGVGPINVIHDELVFLCSLKYAPALMRIMEDVMVNVYPSSLVPLKIDMEVVRRWGDKHRKPAKNADDAEKARVKALHLTEKAIRAECAAANIEVYELPPSYVGYRPGQIGGEYGPSIASPA